MKRLMLLAFLPLSLISLTSCNKKQYYSSTKQIAPFLHEITYNDYEYDKNYETTHFDDETSLDFGCTAIRNGNLYGRNYDYYYSNSPSILVKMKGNKNRLKSIGIANHLGIEEKDIIECEKTKGSEHTLNIIPNFMLDGINEKGVVCNMNVVDMDDGGGFVKSTNPGKEKLYLFFVVRYILDNATSASDAITLLNNRDIYSLSHHENGIHLMVADKDETYIVEFITTPGSETTEVRACLKDSAVDTNLPIMTNFYNNLNQNEIDATYPQGATIETKTYNNNGHGIERYEFVKEHYSDCESLYGMWWVLNSLRYGSMYLNPDEPGWASEDFSQEEIYKWKKETDEGKLIEDYREIYMLTRFVLDSERRDIGRICDTWITMHSEIFDIKEKTMRLNVQEDYVNTYNYDLKF